MSLEVVAQTVVACVIILGLIGLMASIIERKSTEAEGSAFQDSSPTLPAKPEFPTDGPTVDI